MTADITDKIIQEKTHEPYKTIYENYFQIQQYIKCDTNYESISATLANKQPVLVIAGHPKTANLVTRHKQHQVL